MLRLGKVFSAASGYLRRHPEELGRAARNAIGLRFGVPIAAFRWLATELLTGGEVEDLEIDAVPPGLRLEASFPLEGSMLRGGAVVYIDRVEVSTHKMEVEVRLEEVSLRPLDDKKTQLTALLRAHALDLSRPGDLVVNLPDMSPTVLASHGNRVVIDLLKEPKIAKDARLRHAVGLISSLITVSGLETESDHFDMRLRALPRGISAAAEAVGEHLVLPGLRGMQKMLPEAVREDVGDVFEKMVSLVAGADPATPEADHQPAA